MMKRLLFIGLVMLSASIATAEEVTPAPDIYVDQGDWEYMVSAYGEGDVHLFKDGVEVENPYTIEMTDEDQYFLFEAYAQLQGYLPSERVSCEVHVPPVAGPVPLVLPDGGVIVTVTDTCVILEAYIADNDYSFTAMYVDDCPVDYPCTLPRLNEHYGVDVTTVFYKELYEQPLVYQQAVLVPALEGQTQDVNGDGEVNIADVNHVIDHIMSQSGDGPCDINGDGEVNIADVNEMINYILSFI